VDIHRAKVLRQVKLIKDSSNGEDADLTLPVEELQETPSILKGEYATLDTAYKLHDMFFIDLSNLHQPLLVELSVEYSTDRGNRAKNCGP
jgi:hypothetical protein